MSLTQKYVVAALLFAVAVQPAKAGFRVADAVIVCEDRFDPQAKAGERWGKGATADLADVLSRVTGQTIPVYAESKVPTGLSHAIYVGNTAAARAAGCAPAGLRRASFRLLSKDGNAYLYSTTGMGASFAMTEFLQRFADFYWLSFVGNDPVTPNPALEIPECDIVLTPALYGANVYHGAYDTPNKSMKQKWMDYSRRTRIEYSYEIEPSESLSPRMRRSHSSFCYCPPEKYFKDHPEYYSMNPSGRRVHEPVGQLCYTNPDVFDIVYASLVSFIEADRAQYGDKAPRIYDFTQQDNTPWICNCPSCREVIARHNRVKGGHAEGGDCGLVLEFVNRLARKVAEKYPDVVVRMFAYVSTDEPPASGLKPDKNVMVWYCDLYSQCDHQLPLEHPFNAARAARLRAWARCAQKLEIWDYMLYDGSVPEVSVDAIAADARLFRSLGINRVMQEAEYRGQPFYELNTFLMGQLWFNPDQDVDRLVDIYCRMYGPGARQMRAAIDLLRGLALSKPPVDMVSWHSRTLPWRNVEDMAAFRDIVEKAHELTAPGSVERWRVEKVLATACRELVRLYRISGDLAARSKALDGWRRCAVSYATYGKTSEKARQNSAEAALREIEQETLWFADAPSEVLAANPADVYCLDISKAECGAGAQRVTDPDSTRPRSIVWHAGKMQALKHIRCGVYDRQYKKSFPVEQISPSPEQMDEKYHWFRLGVTKIGPQSILWLPYDWSCAFHLWDFFVFCDGAKEDLNCHEVWMSCKFQGPAYVKGSTKPNGFYFDRLILLRVPEAEYKERTLHGDPARGVPVTCKPFPDRVTAAIWRNWGLVPKVKLAEVLGTTPETVTRLATEMGLPAEPPLRPDWAARGYITIFRRNWHLLSTDQIRRLLGWSRVHYQEMTTKYLLARLGNSKPLCPDTFYDPSGEVTNAPARRAIAAVLQREGVDPAAPEEPRFAFADAYDVADPAKNASAKADGNGLFGLKMIYSYCGRGTDPLSSEAMGYSYPDGLLAEYARLGVNAIWMHPDLQDLDDTTRVENLRTLVARAARHGQKVFLYLNEPYPAECTSEPGVLERLSKRMEALFRAVPGLGGFFNITASERKTNCASHGPQVQKRCPKCADRKQSDIVVEVCRAMYEGMKRGNPSAVGIAWNWGWQEKDLKTIVDALPDGMQVLGVSEEGISVVRGGLTFTTVDYVMSVPEPGPRVKALFAAAKARGLRTMAKVPVNVTWEMPGAPYLPLTDLAAEHAVKLAELGCDGLLLSFTLGGAPSPQLQLYRDLRAGDTKDAILDRLAKSLYGPAAVESARAAWAAFGEGFRSYPSQVKNLYWGPQQLGAANMLYTEPTGMRSTMVFYPWDDLVHWHWLFKRDNWLALMENVVRGFADGNAAWTRVVASATGPGKELARREAGLFKAEELCFRSIVDQSRFIVARDAGDRTGMKECARRELDTAKEFLGLVAADSRLGFESSNQYFYVPQDIREKIVRCAQIVSE